MRCFVVSLLCVPMWAVDDAMGPPGPDDDQTSVTQSVLSMMSRGGTGYYTGGKGVLVRDIYDGLQNGPNVGVPVTFWSNDIFSISQMYPDRVDLDVPGVTNIYDYASVGVIIGSAMSNLFYDYDNLQSDSWGWGVFYGHDSNSLDIRCRWISDISMYDCPGGYIFWGQTFQSDPTKLGTGGYEVGNPYANSAWGGGAGCHFDPVSKVIDQINAYDDAGDNLVQDSDCQCNYVFSYNWGDWMDLFGTATTMSQHSLHADQAICWVNNVRDMIMMQNWLWWSYCSGVWQPSDSIFSKAGTRMYMGWNEVPVDRTAADDPLNWDSFLIKLPANVCGNGGGDDTIECLSDDQQSRLAQRISGYTQKGSVVVGSDYIGSRPGSYTVVAREYVDENNNWFRWVFCQNWNSPGDADLKFLQMGPGSPDGACYLEWN